MPGQISMIQALECNCASIDRLAEIQEEISKLLGDEVQVIEFTTTAIARAKAREGVKAEGRASIARLERLAALMVPLSVIGASLLVGLLSLINVRERRAEVGILRAIGVGSSRILGLFITKAVIVGVLGAAVGYVVGFQGFGMARGIEAADGATRGLASRELFDPRILGLVLGLAPLLAVLASWVPAVIASGQDPAVVLREE
jgi:ABC-type lipoprotein release transport system permease subunit